MVPPLVAATFVGASASPLLCEDTWYLVNRRSRSTCSAVCTYSSLIPGMALLMEAYLELLLYLQCARRVQILVILVAARVELYIYWLYMLYVEHWVVISSLPDCCAWSSIYGRAPQLYPQCALQVQVIRRVAAVVLFSKYDVSLGI